MSNLDFPGLQTTSKIVEQDGRGSVNFVNWFNAILAAVKGQFAIINSQITTLQQIQAALVSAQTAAAAAQATAAAAQAVADTGGGGGGAVSGSSQGTINVGAAWSTAALVSLTAVVAGNLTISGTGPQQTAATTMSHFTTVNGAWRIVEVIGGVDTVVFSGTFICTRSVEGSEGVLIEFTVLYNETDTASTSIARTTTGVMDYRLDLMGAGGITIFDVLGYLYVRRAP